MAEVNPFLQPLIAFGVEDDQPSLKPGPPTSIEQLAAIFPHYERELLAVILESHDLEAAVGVLLEMETDTPPDVARAQAAVDEQLTVDEQLAVQLQEELSREADDTSDPAQHEASRVDVAVARANAQRRSSQSSILGTAEQLTDRIKSEYSALVAKLSQPTRARVGLVDGAMPLLVSGPGGTSMGPVDEPDMSGFHSSTRIDAPATVASPLLVRS
jgi:hypothetical protein